MESPGFPALVSSDKLSVIVGTLSHSSIVRDGAVDATASGSGGGRIGDPSMWREGARKFHSVRKVRIVLGRLLWAIPGLAHFDKGHTPLSRDVDVHVAVGVVPRNVLLVDKVLDAPAHE